jgi:hypothetical protein
VNLCTVLNHQQEGRAWPGKGRGRVLAHPGFVSGGLKGRRRCCQWTAAEQGGTPASVRTVDGHGVWRSDAVHGELQWRVENVCGRLELVGEE